FESVDALGRQVGKIVTYGTLRYSVNVADQGAQAINQRGRAMASQAQGAIAFADPEILAIGLDTLRVWIKDEPRLAIYEHYVEELADRHAHIRSPEVEEILGRVNDPFRTATMTHSLLVDGDLSMGEAESSEGQTLPIAQGNINALLTDGDREVRRTSWERYADAHLAFKNSIANVVITGVKQNVFVGRARRYSSALEASLSEDHLPVEVFYSLLDSYRRHVPIWHRYWALRRRTLGYDKLHVYDTKAPLMTEKENISYDQAVEWVCAGMTPLGEEYCTLMRRGLAEQRWVDIYPNQGKRSGAFSTGTPGTHPFILMSYNNDLNSMSTLAHEIGHSMHSYYSWQTQPMAYSRYTIFAAEVASNFNQALVRGYLLENNPDPEFQIALLEEALSKNFHRYFFIMPTLARFELELHERVERGEGLSADGMIDLMADLFQEGYGSEVVMDRSRVGITWAQFPIHMYLNFYVFQYATGIAGAYALAERVRSGEPDAVARYLEFLKAGSSLYPLEALKRAGVDLTTPEPVERAFSALDQMVTRLEELLEQRDR
nr:oligoendopeptidase F [Ardenticatenales bacterium]